MISDLIHVVKQSDNLWLQRKLEEIEKILKEEPNDMVLGEKLRKLLN